MKVGPRTRARSTAVVALAAAVGVTAVSMVALAQTAPPPLPIPPSLKTVKPRLPDVSAYVKSDPSAQQKLIVLGKALFWDQSVGSSGNACATCHFSAGADARIKNQINPGFNDHTANASGDATFGDAQGRAASEVNPPAGSAHVHSGPNYTLKAADFPFHQLSNPLDKESTVTYDTNDVVSSAGAYNGTYTSTGKVTAIDICGQSLDPIYHIPSPTGDKNTRRVEPRNTPTMINAVFNKRNFWDGRASNLFNGQSPLGLNDPNAFLVKQVNGTWQKVAVQIPNSALASQSVGPVVSDFEMICNGRTLAEFGKKLVGRQPLAAQKVSNTDSVLASFRNTSGLANGLVGTYSDLIKAVFKDEWWSSGTVPTGQGLPFEGYDQMAANFSLFWGIAIQAYQATLISDDSLFDQVQEGRASFTAQQAHGLQLFNGPGGCQACHNGPAFSEATTFDFKNPADESTFGAAFDFRDRGVDMKPLNLSFGPNGISFELALADEGFFNLGVTPTGEDLGVNNVVPNSIAAKYLASIRNGGPAVQVIDGLTINPCKFTIPLSGDTANGCPVPNPAGQRLGVDGTFKIPDLRNVELTGPYFHNGGAASLEQVLAFYRRGGNSQKLSIPGDIRIDTTGFGTNRTNLGPLLPLAGFSDQDISDVIAFLKTLTDNRVKCEQAPFDHPSLRVPEGIEGDENGYVDVNANGQVDEGFRNIPAVGSGGLPALGKSCLQPFNTQLSSN
ncbi:MAG: cytochrome-c peroxidase [Actinomycetota bacterium]